MLSFFGPEAPELGVFDGRLLPCLGSPNCVASMTDSQDHALPPIAFSLGAQDAKTEINRIKEVVATHFPQATLIDEEADYLRYEFRSTVFRFVDDVEFLAIPEDRLIHFRSASRVGRSDLGVNRKRIERIRQRLQK